MKFKDCLLGLLLCPAAHTFAQNINARSLGIGDTMPNITFMVYNDPRSKIQLSDLKGKAVIIDIWGTYCAACVEDLPTLSKLQGQFSNSLQILSVSQESAVRVEQFLATNKNARGVNFPLAGGDSLLPKYFRFNTIPHQIWIDAAGIIRAITGKGETTVSNIQKLIQGQMLHIPEKKDFLEFDSEAPLLQNLTAGSGSVLQQSVFTKYQPGIGTRAAMHIDTAKHTRRIVYYNMILANLYRLIIPGLQLNRIVLENLDDDFLFNPARSLYCLEFTGPLDRPGVETNNLLHATLDNALHIDSRFEQRKVIVYVLKSTGPLSDSVISKRGNPSHNLYHLSDPVKMLRNKPLDVLIDFLNDRLPRGQGAAIFLNETGFDKNVDMDLPVADYNDIPALQKALSRYGFELIQEQRTIPMFVITKRE